jgi:hypothetical protein
MYGNKVKALKTPVFNFLTYEAVYDMFIPFIMMQQMTELSSAASEEEHVAIITKAVLSLLKHKPNDGNSSQASES